MFTNSCRLMNTKRCRLMCKQRCRQQPVQLRANRSARYKTNPR